MTNSDLLTKQNQPSDKKNALDNCRMLLYGKINVRMLPGNEYTDPILVLSGMVFVWQSDREKSFAFGMKNPADGLKSPFLAHGQFPCQRKPKLFQYTHGKVRIRQMPDSTDSILFFCGTEIALCFRQKHSGSGLWESVPVFGKTKVETS